MTNPNEFKVGDKVISLLPKPGIKEGTSLEVVQIDESGDAPLLKVLNPKGHKTSYRPSEVLKEGETRPSGHEECQIGLKYERGEGVAKDLKEAYIYYYRSASQGDPRGMNNLGYAIENGRGVTKNPKKAHKWYVKSASAGDGYGLMHLAYAYLDGDYVPFDQVKAFELFTRSAELECCYGVGGLACCYRRGVGTEKDEKKAYELLVKASKLGDEYSSADLGEAYEKGYFGLDVDYSKALSYYQKASVRDVGWAYMGLARIHGFGLAGLPERDLALEEYKKALAKGQKHDLGMERKLGFDIFEIIGEQEKVVTIDMKGYKGPLWLFGAVEINLEYIDGNPFLLPNEFLREDVREAARKIIFEYSPCLADEVPPHGHNLLAMAVHRESLQKAAMELESLLLKHSSSGYRIENDLLNELRYWPKMSEVGSHYLIHEPLKAEIAFYGEARGFYLAFAEDASPLLSNFYAPIGIRCLERIINCLYAYCDSALNEGERRSRLRIYGPLLERMYRQFLGYVKTLDPSRDIEITDRLSKDFILALGDVPSMERIYEHLRSGKGFSFVYGKTYVSIFLDEDACYYDGKEIVVLQTKKKPKCYISLDKVKIGGKTLLELLPLCLDSLYFG